MPNLENENQSKRLINCAGGFHVFDEPSSSALPFGPVGSFFSDFCLLMFKPTDADVPSLFPYV